MADIRSIDTGKTDAELAMDYRERMRALLEPCAALRNEARANGLVLDFAISTDQFGRSFVAPISVTKPL